MEIEQKEMERIKADFKRNSSSIINEVDYLRGKTEEHLHLQNEVIQPLRDDLKSLQERQPEINREALSVAIAEAEEEFEVKNKQYVTELESNLYKLEAENKSLREALKRASFLMQTSGGTAGRDEEMVKLIEEINQLLTKHEDK